MNRYLVTIKLGDQFVLIMADGLNMGAVEQAIREQNVGALVMQIIFLQKLVMNTPPIIASA